MTIHIHIYGLSDGLKEDFTKQIFLALEEKEPEISKKVCITAHPEAYVKNRNGSHSYIFIYTPSDSAFHKIKNVIQGIRTIEVVNVSM